MRWQDQSRPWDKMELPCNDRDIQLFQACNKIQIGDGKKFFFWKDNWLEGLCLKDIAPNLFKLAKRKNRDAFTAIAENDWLHSFRQITDVETIHELVQLGGLLSQIALTENEEDKTAGQGTTLEGILFFLLNWKAKALPKQIFLGWLILHHKVVTAENLLIRHWKCDWIRPLCRSASEDID